MTQYIARWYTMTSISAVGKRVRYPESKPRDAFVTADNPSHAEQLVKQMDQSAAGIQLETCGPYKGP